MGCGASVAVQAGSVKPIHGVQARKLVDDSEGVVNSFRDGERARSARSDFQRRATLASIYVEIEPKDQSDDSETERETDKTEKKRKSKQAELDALNKKEAEMEARAQEMTETIQRQQEDLKRAEEETTARHRERDWWYQKENGTQNGYLKALTFTDDAPCPKHWQGPGLEDQSSLLAYGDAIRRWKWDFYRYNLNPERDVLYNEVEDLLLKTWASDLVGFGHDAYLLGDIFRERGIRIKKIEIVQNPETQQQYNAQRAKLLKRYLAEKTYASFEEATKTCGNMRKKYTGSILATDAVGPNLKDMLHSEVNEVFLFHGTKKENVKALCAQSPDPRLSRSGMLGRGVYFADSPTKSDQYSDAPKKRIKGPLQMFVSRALLGEMFVTGHKGDYVKPPCSVCGICLCKDHGDKFCNSIVYLPGKGKLFREFILFDRNLVSLDFLITYERA